MSLTRFTGSPFADPLDPFAVQAYVDPFERGQWGLQPAMQRTQSTVRTFAPLLAADVIEGPDDFHVHVDLPGVLPEDLEINISNGFIHLKAERKQIHEDTLGLTHNIERSYGRVSRSVQLPARADPDSAKASFRNGVLSVSFAKREGAIQGKRLVIE